MSAQRALSRTEQQPVAVGRLSVRLEGGGRALHYMRCQLLIIMEDVTREKEKHEINVWAKHGPGHTMCVACGDRHE